MSQTSRKSSGGSIPGNVPTSFVTDSGTIIPSANTVNINGGQTSSNVDNGIQVIANPDTSNNGVVQLTNRFQGSATTVDAATSPIFSFTPTVIGTYAVEARVAAYNTTATIGAAYSVFVGIRFDGVNSNLTGIADVIDNEEGAMSAANVSFTTSGASFSLNGVGYALQTINWSAVGLYTFVGA